MARYENSGVYLTDFENEWDDDRFSKLGVKLDLKTLYRTPTRENLARAFAVAKGMKLEDTYEAEDGSVHSDHHQMGQCFIDLLTLAAEEKEMLEEKEKAEKEKAEKEEAEKENEKENAENPEADNENADQKEEEKKPESAVPKERTEAVCNFIQQIYTQGHHDFPKDINPLKQRSEGKPWAQDALDYAYYMTLRAFEERKLPDIDYQNPEEVKKIAKEQKACATIIQDLVQISDGVYGEHIEEKYPGFEEEKIHLSDAALMINMISDLAIELTNPPSERDLLNHLAARNVFDQYGAKLRGKSLLQDIVTEKTSAEILADKMTINQFIDTLNFEAMTPVEQMTLDYVNRKPESCCPYILKDGKFYLSPAVDKRIPKLDLGKVSDNFAKGPAHKAVIFDQLFGEFPNDPSLPAEPAYKKIYIDGKNAYDLYKDKFNGNETDIKAAILDTLVLAKSRVEMVRTVQQANGQVKAFAVPVRADLKLLDNDKKWYQHSLEKQEEKLWSHDPEAASRKAAIEKAEEEKHKNNFFKNILNAANEVRREYMGTDPIEKEKFVNAEREMQKDFDVAREWGILKLAQAYSQIDEAARLLQERSAGRYATFEDAMSIVHMVASAEEGVSEHNFQNMAIGRQFKKYADLIDNAVKGEVPEDFYEKNDLETVKRQLTYFREKWAREDEEAKENPLTKEEQAIRDFKRGDTLEGFRETIGRHFIAQLHPFAESLKEYVENKKNNIILTLENDARRAELDEKFLGHLKEYKNLGMNEKFPCSDTSAYDPFRRVRECGEKVIEAVVETIRGNFNLQAAPDVCRSQFLAIRRAMEAIGMDQKEVDDYAEKLRPEQKETFQYIRSWEKEFVRENENDPIHLPKGVKNLEEAVTFVTDIYKNVYCDKMGYLNRLEPDFMDRMEHVKSADSLQQGKQVSFREVQDKESTAKSQTEVTASVNHSRTLSSSPKPAEKATDDGMQP